MKQNSNVSLLVKPWLSLLCTASAVVVSVFVIVNNRINEKIGSEDSASRSPGDYHFLMGRSAPLFEIEGIDGESVALQPNDNIVRMLIFVDSGCLACEDIYPNLLDIDKNIHVAMVGMGNRSDLKEKKLKYRFPLSIGYDSKKEINKLYEISIIPTVVLIDRQGIIRYAAGGTQGLKRTEKELSRLRRLHGLRGSL